MSLQLAGSPRKAKYNSPVNTKKVALIYTRVSTGKQAEEGVSLEAQENQCRFLAERMGLPVIEVFREAGESGAISPAERSAFSALLRKRAELEASGECRVVVIAYDFSRVSRSVSDLLELVDVDRGGVLLSTVQENFDTSTPTGELLRTMLAAINQFNRKMGAIRTRDALAQTKAKGTQLGGRRVDQLVKPEVVLMIKQCLTEERLSMRRTVETLNNLGLPTPRGDGGRWSFATLQRVVQAMEAGRFDLETGKRVEKT